MRHHRRCETRDFWEGFVWGFVMASALALLTWWMA